MPAAIQLPREQYANSGSIPETGGVCSCLLSSAMMKAEAYFSRSQKSYQ
jgi:hypothetical protein